MRTTLNLVFDRLRTNFWFVPSIMILASIGVALFLLWLDARLDPGIEASIAWAYSGGPEGARSLLSTIAGSMITAASVTFSLASVAISIAAQQYGSRVLRSFMRDRVTQFLLGTFVSTFVYSVLIVRSIRGSEVSGGFVPAISVTGAIVLSVTSLILLVYFVHHVSASIQSSHIVLMVLRDLQGAVPELYPETANRPRSEDSDRSTICSLPAIHIPHEGAGYIQSIDLDLLFEWARRNDAVIEVAVRPGDHVLPSSDLALVRTSHTVSADDLKEIDGAFALGGQRTALQDIRFQFQQLTDVTIRALSPGINDPFTAINAIDALGEAAFLLARRPRALEERLDETGTTRLLISTARLEEILTDAFGHIALYAAQDKLVMATLRRALSAVRPLLADGREQAMYEALVNRIDSLELQADRSREDS